MLTTTIIFTAALLCFGAASGIAINSVLDPKDTLSAICTMCLLGLVGVVFAANRLQKSLPEPLPTPNTNFNQLP